MWLFSLKERRLWGVFIVTFQHLQEADKKKKHRPFSSACCDGTRGNDSKLKEGRLILGIRKRFFTMRVVKQCNMLPEEVVDVPSLETFKACLDKALSNLI